MIDQTSPDGFSPSIPFPIPASSSSPDPVPVTPWEARTFEALAAWEAGHADGPSLSDLARELSISRTAVRKSILLLVLKGLVRHRAGEARSYRLVRPTPPLKIVGRVGAGKLVEWYELPPEDFSLTDLFVRPGWLLIRVNTDLFEPLHVLRGDVLAVDERGDARRLFRPRMPKPCADR